MIRKPTVEKNIINLDGPDGNANVLLGIASRLCSEVGYAAIGRYPSSCEQHDACGACNESRGIFDVVAHGRRAEPVVFECVTQIHLEGEDGDQRAHAKNGQVRTLQ